MTEMKDLKPAVIWRNFHALTQVPRPSGHLDKVRRFLLDFAQEKGVEAFEDEAGNIVMRKPATPGMENRKTVILQAHMDMVPQKEKGSDHNFETDPIETYVDGEWVKAKGTTLGADDGLGVAAIMAVMEATDLKHGPVEALITADEETGMYGANGLPAGELEGEILLNLDTEQEGELIIGSAGGVDITASLEYKEAETDPEDIAVRITLKGLKGGHSGLEIGAGRGNANKMLVRLVREAIAEDDAQLANWHGGNMRNAIPREAEAVLTLPRENKEDLMELVADYQETFNDEYKGIENGIELTIEEVALPKSAVPQEIQDNLVDAIYAAHDGVWRYIPSIPGIVETSSNLAIVDIAQERRIGHLTGELLRHGRHEGGAQRGIWRLGAQHFQRAHQAHAGNLPNTLQRGAYRTSGTCRTGMQYHPFQVSWTGYLLFRPYPTLSPHAQRARLLALHGEVLATVSKDSREHSRKIKQNMARDLPY